MVWLFRYGNLQVKLIEVCSVKNALFNLWVQLFLPCHLSVESVIFTFNEPDPSFGLCVLTPFSDLQKPLRYLHDLIFKDFLRRAATLTPSTLQNLCVQSRYLCFISLVVLLNWLYLSSHAAFLTDKHEGLLLRYSTRQHGGVARIPRFACCVLHRLFELVSRGIYQDCMRHSLLVGTGINHDHLSNLSLYKFIEQFISEGYRVLFKSVCDVHCRLNGRVCAFSQNSV